MSDNPTFVFYGTFGCGHPGAPGYLRVKVSAPSSGEAYAEAYSRMNQATGGKWCALYDSLDRVHELDRIFRGEA